MITKDKKYFIPFHLEKQFIRGGLVTKGVYHVDDKMNSTLKNLSIQPTYYAQLYSLYVQLLKNKVFITHAKIDKALIKDMYKEHDISEITKMLDISPATISNILFPKKSFIKTERDSDNFNYAQDNDLTISNAEVQRVAEQFEEDIGKWLTERGIRYKTQHVMTEEQIEKFGTPVSTPDFYIIDELVINSHRVHWIDAKNYYGCNVSLFYKKLVKQANKYNTQYGSGAFVFKYGFTNDRKFAPKNTLCLDWLQIRNIK